MTSFKGYVAESRATGATWTMISEAAVHEAERRSRAFGDAAPVTTEDLWARVAKDMSAKPYKALAVDLAKAALRDREKAIAAFLTTSHKVETMKLEGRDVGREVRGRLQADAVRRQTKRHIPALDEAMARNAAELRLAASDINAHLSGVRTEAEVARLSFEAAAVAQSLSPGQG